MTIGYGWALEPSYLRGEVDRLCFPPNALNAEDLENAGLSARPGQGKRIPWKPGRLWERGVRDWKASKAYFVSMRPHTYLWSNSLELPPPRFRHR
jgi:hypothetical protein